MTIILKGAGREHKKLPFRFRAGATTTESTLSLVLAQPAYVSVACLSLMPADTWQGMRVDTLQEFLRLGPPFTWWAGGNFVSGYDRKDGIGDLSVDLVGIRPFGVLSLPAGRFLVVGN